MLVRVMNNLMKMSPEGDGGGAGGSGAGGNGSFLTAPAGGSGTPSGTPDAGTPSGADKDQPSGDAGANPPTGGNTTSDWRSQLPQELQEDASIKKYTSVDALARAYINAQRHLGSEKIPLPGKHATPEDWKNVFHKLGLPEAPDKYEVKFKEGVSLSEEFSKTFKEQAYQAGVLPQQAQALADWFSEMNLKSEELIANERTNQFKKEQESLQKEWGQGYNVKIARAMKLLEDHGGKELIDHLNTVGFGADSKVVKFLATLGDKMYAEHTIVNESGALTSGKTPKEIQGEIQRLMKEPAYFEKNHPNHRRVVEEVQDLYKELHPKK